MVGFAGVVAAAIVVMAVAAGGLGVISMASVDGGGQPLHKVGDVSVSDNGRYVAFIANQDGQRNLVLRDRAAGTSIDVWPSGAAFPRLSGDGSTIVFVAGEVVLAYDVATAATSTVNIGPAGETPGPGSTSFPGGVSDDGRYVVFSHRNLSFGVDGVFLRDRAAQTTTQVSNLNITLSPSSYGPGPVSDDGNTVVFTADATVAGARNRQVFYWQRSGVQGGIASVTAANGAGPRDSVAYDMTPDGRYIAFGTSAAMTADDPNSSEWDVYVRDLLAGATSYAGANFGDGDPRIGSNDEASISDDGMKIAFRTTAHIAGKWTNSQDVVLANRATNTVELLSVNRDGNPAGDSFQPSLSGDARYVAFISYARDLVAPFSTSECVEMEEDEDTGRDVLVYTECRNAYVLDRAATGAFLPATGGTVTNGTTTVQVPSLGAPSTVTITPVSSPQPVPDGYQILGQQLLIEGPVATWDNPLRLTFVVAGVAPSDVAVIRDGVPMVDCIGSPTALADGSPCITSRTTNGAGEAVIVALTPHLSVWTVAKAPPPTTPTVTFASLCEATQAAAGQKGIAQSLCAKLAAASAARGRGDGPAAAKQLDAYRAELAAQSGKALTAAQVTSLTDKSRLL